MDNMTMNGTDMNMTMNSTEMANDTITDDGRRKLLARSLLEEMMPEMDNMTMNGTMNGTEMANDTIPEEPVSDDGRRKLQQLGDLGSSVSGAVDKAKDVGQQAVGKVQDGVDTVVNKTTEVIGKANDTIQ